jgi:hypothetical protein
MLSRPIDFKIQRTAFVESLARCRAKISAVTYASPDEHATRLPARSAIAKTTGGGGRRTDFDYTRNMPSQAGAHNNSHNDALKCKKLLEIIRNLSIVLGMGCLGLDNTPD